MIEKHYDFQEELNALEDKQKNKENGWLVVCRAVQRKVTVLLLNTDTKSNFPFHPVQTDYI